LKTWPGPDFWVPGFPILAWNDPERGEKGEETGIDQNI